MATALAVCLAGAATAEDAVPAVVFPDLPRSAAGAAGFAPAGWAVEAQASGDLDRDGFADLAVVLHGADPRNVIQTGPAPGSPTFDTNPRILAVALGRGEGKDYRLVLADHALISRRTSVTQDDVFEAPGSLAIHRGVLAIELGYFASAGGWDAGHRTLRLQYQQGSFVLVGLEGWNVDRSSGVTCATSVNYLTGQAWVRTGSIETDAATVRRYPVRQVPPTLARVGDGLAFDPLPEARAGR